MNGVLESARMAAAWTEGIRFSKFEEITFEARENAFGAGCLSEWWDEFWHGFALLVAHENRRIL